MLTKPWIVWQTDFTKKWGSVASMIGVCKSVNPKLECIDITHDIPPYDIWTASMELDYVEPYWVEGTVFMSVVDPGVGTSRKACVALLRNRKYVVTPDNGSLSHLAIRVGIKEIREIDETTNRLEGSEHFSVFHGRDIFAYTAARLASGIISFEGVGPTYPVTEVVILEDAACRASICNGRADGIITSTNDHFGSVEFNIPLIGIREAGFQYGDILQVDICENERRVFSEKVLYQRSFGYVAPGRPILFNASSGYLSLGLNQASFCEKYSCKRGHNWHVTVKK